MRWQDSELSVLQRGGSGDGEVYLRTEVHERETEVLFYGQVRVLWDLFTAEDSLES